MKKLIVILLFIVLLSGCTVRNEPREAKNVQDGVSAQPNASAAQNDSQAEQIALTEGIDYIKIDQPAEDFTAWDFEGNEVQLSDYKGNVVFLYFWATWCGPCREKMPMIQEFYEDHKNQGVVVLAISSTVVELRGGNDANIAKDQVKRFIEDNGFTFPVLLDRYSEGWEIYQQRGIPANYVIDREGIVRFFRPGSYLDKQQMIEFLRLAEE
jgi:cytochrome c-type biogenesis protein